MAEDKKKRKVKRRTKRRKPKRRRVFRRRIRFLRARIRKLISRMRRRMRVEAIIATSPLEIFSYAGHAQQTVGSPDWFEKSWTTTGGFENTSFRIYFHYASGTSYTGDLAIDYVKVGSELIGDEFDVAEGWQQGLNDHTYSTIVEAQSLTYGDLVRNYGSGSYQNWNVDADGTPSGSTGPTSAYNGSMYVYAETSSNGNNSNYWLRSPVITPTGTAEVISAYISAYGGTIGTLTVYVVPED